jgi:flagella basal body P-ring formation protein FlgA
MTSFASTCAVLLAVFLAAAAADEGTASGLTGDVAERIAETWGVPASSVALQWGHVPDGLPVTDEVPFRLVGRGKGGWFAVVLEPPREDPVALRVRAGVRDTVWVATRPMSVGSRLQPSDLRADVRLTWGPPRGPAEPPAAGWEVRRPLAKGDEVSWPSVVPPSVVAAGEEIQLEWSRGDVRVIVTGVALNSATQGGVVRVRVPGRSQPLRGVVVAPGSAVLGEGRRS